MTKLITLRDTKLTMFCEVCLFVLKQKFDDYMTKHFLQELTLGKDLILKMNGDKVIGYCVYFKRFLFIPALTWVVDREYRRRGIASELFDEITKDKRIICIRTINKGSFYFAKKKGFIKVFHIPIGTYMILIKIFTKG